MRRPITYLCFALALIAPAALYAGQVYGTVVSEGKGLSGASLEIQCGADAPVTAMTAGDGSYRVNVPQQGQCSISLPSYAGKPSAMIFSSPNPSLFNFDLVKLADGKFELRRR